MHGAALPDFQQPGALRRVQCALQLHLGIDPVQHGLLVQALRAVLDLAAKEPQANLHICERPLLPSRIQRDGDRHSGAERGRNQLVGIGSAIGAAGADRFVDDQMMRADRDLLRKVLRAAANDDNLVGLRHDSLLCQGNRSASQSRAISAISRCATSANALRRRISASEIFPPSSASAAATLGYRSNTALRITGAAWYGGK